ncbi:MAG: DUF721 domain-containing protein [Sphingomonas sp.]|nr:DUF721 domain-containing protein [Sphingomonas sp.]RZV50084.1 MAG: DUF721 domain-containing protein [Sphingomonadaceae bacterium]
MAKTPYRPGSRKNHDPDKRIGKVRRAGDLVGKIGGASFKRFGFVQGAIVHRWPEIVGENYAKVSVPESIKFPQGRRTGGTLTLLVEGAHAPLMQHMAPLIIDKVNAFFGHGAIAKLVYRQGRVPKPEKRVERPGPKPVPKELGEGLREVADPELRAVLESLAGAIEGSQGGPVIPKVGKLTDPITKRSENDS